MFINKHNVRLLFITSFINGRTPYKHDKKRNIVTAQCLFTNPSSSVLLCKPIVKKPHPCIPYKANDVVQWLCTTKFDWMLDSIFLMTVRRQPILEACASMGFTRALRRPLVHDCTTGQSCVITVPPLAAEVSCLLQT